MSSLWAAKIADANKKYLEWEGRFSVAKLKEYWEGQQWQNVNDDYRPYMLNMVFTAIQTKLASNVLKNPKFLVDPMPGMSDWNLEAATESAQIKADTLNALVKNPRSGFMEAVNQAALEYFFRFAVIEVGYDADWDHPAAKPTLTTAHDDSEVDVRDAKKLPDVVPIPTEERIYWKHIQADSFRVVVSSKSLKLENCLWCGYYEYIDNETLLNSDEFDIPTNYTPQFTDSFTETDFLAAQTKIWKIWDNVAMKRLTFVEGIEEPIAEENYEHLPFITYRGPLRAPENRCWYPIPVVSQWLSQQDEVNETREQMRNLRKRSIRKFQTDNKTYQEGELEKFTSEEDGAVIFKRPGSVGIEPIPNPEMGVTLTTDLIASKDDFNHIAAVSEARQSDRTTATQAKINAGREAIRESSEQGDFKAFLSEAGHLALVFAQENFTEGIWAKFSTDQGDGWEEELISMVPSFRYIQAQELSDGYDFTVSVSVVEESAEVMEGEMNSFVSFLSLLAQFPVLAMNPNLIAEAAQKTRYRNKKVIRALQQAAMLSMLGQAATETAGMQGDNAAGVNQAKATVDNSSENAIGEIQAQLQNQLG